MEMVHDTAEPLLNSVQSVRSALGDLPVGPTRHIAGTIPIVRESTACVQHNSLYSPLHLLLHYSAGIGRSGMFLGSLLEI